MLVELAADWVAAPPQPVQQRDEVDALVAEQRAVAPPERDEPRRSEQPQPSLVARPVARPLLRQSRWTAAQALDGGAEPLAQQRQHADEAHPQPAPDRLAAARAATKEEAAPGGAVRAEAAEGARESGEELGARGARRRGVQQPQRGLEPLGARDCPPLPLLDERVHDASG